MKSIGNNLKTYVKNIDIFSVDSTNIGKTPFLQMEIDTGNNPPICQKP